MQDLFEKISNITKASAYDIVSKHNAELLEENKALKERVKFLENLIDEYAAKMIDKINSIQ